MLNFSIAFADEPNSRQGSHRTISRHRQMPAKTLVYDLPRKLSVADIKARLSLHFRVQQQPLRHVERTYLDTFDWRVNGSGHVLEHACSGGAMVLTWRNLTSAAATKRAADSIPRFVWDMPPGRMRGQLEQVLEMRALLPIARTTGTVRSFAILDKEEKTLLRLELRREQLAAPAKGTASRTWTRLHLMPVRGYDKILKRTLMALGQMAGSEPLMADPADAYLLAAGVSTGNYTGKPSYQLSPGDRTDVAAKRILLSLLDIMQANETGMREDIDSEFLHDFRVAIRRTRSMLTQVKRIFPKPRTRRFRREFAWLGKMTGAARDMDVYLLAYDDYRNGLPDELREHLAPMQTFLSRHKSEEYARLVRVLDSQHYLKLVADWRRFLETAPPRKSTVEHATKPVQVVADHRIWKTYRAVMKEGMAIKTSTPAEALHELRITCKKLRYLMEFYRLLYPKLQLSALIRSLKELQDNLGEFQDLEVQQHALNDFETAMQRESNVPKKTLRAMDALIAQLSQRQAQVRTEFASRFTAFARGDNQKVYRRLFSPKD